MIQRLLEVELQRRASNGETTAPGASDRPSEAEASLSSLLAAERLPETDWELVEALWSQIPEKEFEKLPPDGSEQHDHYIDGSPKRDS